VVHEVDGGRSRVTRPGVGTDHSLPHQRILDALIADVAVERLRDRLLEDDRDQLLVLAQDRLDLVAGRRIPDPRISGGALAEQTTGAAKELLIGEDASDVLLREAVPTQVRDRLIVVQEGGERRAV
jgi:hypothetical protein